MRPQQWLLGGIPHYLCVVPDRASVNGSGSKPEVFDLIVPGRDGVSPTAVTPGQVLTDADPEAY